MDAKLLLSNNVIYKEGDAYTAYLSVENQEEIYYHFCFDFDGEAILTLTQKEMDEALEWAKIELKRKIK